MLSTQYQTAMLGVESSLHNNAMSLTVSATFFLYKRFPHFLNIDAAYCKLKEKKCPRLNIKTWVYASYKIHKIYKKNSNWNESFYSIVRSRVDYWTVGLSFETFLSDEIVLPILTYTYTWIFHDMKSILAKFISCSKNCDRFTTFYVYLFPKLYLWFEEKVTIDVIRL